VVVVLLLFLGNIRAALVTAAQHSLALLDGLLRDGGARTSANLISSVRSTSASSSIRRHHDGEHLPAPGSMARGTSKRACAPRRREVERPMAFSTLIIGVAFCSLHDGPASPEWISAGWPAPTRSHWRCRHHGADSDAGRDDLGPERRG